MIEAIGQGISRIFGLPIEQSHLLEAVSFAFDPNRRQYHSTPILDRLARLAPQHAVKVLGIVDVDLFIPILTHVYGEAQLGGKASIVSTFRLNEGRLALSMQEKFRQRLFKEAIHELGHTFNLRHCPDHTCIMHYCRSEADVDRKSDQLCRYCRIMLLDQIKRVGGEGPE
jgi:archaemetzincin